MIDDATDIPELPPRLSIPLIVLLLLTPIPTFSDMILSAGGEPRSVVVVAEDAIEPEKHAAAELASILEQVTGATFQVGSLPDGDLPRLLVGPQAARLADPEFSTDGLGKEGIVIRTVGDDLILAGGAPRGTLYAVYTFLEDVVGCRWWTPEVSHIPRQPELTIPDLNHRHVPVFEYRETYWNGWVDADWGPRMKHNGARSHVGEKQGDKFDEVGGVHSFYRFLPPDKYFDDHPEWYSLLDGERTHERSQLCLTNTEMMLEMVDSVKAAIRKKGSPQTMVWVSQEDHHGYCECDNCRALDEREGGPTGSVIHFVNAVADEIAKEIDDVSVKTLAYDYSQKPPDHLAPDPKVIIELCTIGVSYLHPYTHGQNRQFRERLKGWAKMTDRIYIWDYLVNFENYFAPHPNLRTLGPNVEFFARNGVAGIFAQGAYEGDAGHTELAALRRWVLLKLYWDPSLAAVDLIDEFLAGYYGDAAPHIKAYIDLVHDEAEVSNVSVGMTQSAFSDDYLSFETMSQSLGHLRAAAAAVSGDADLSERVEIATVSILYVFLLRWDEFRWTAESIGAEWPLDEEMVAVYDHYVAVTEKHGMAKFAEQNQRGQWPSVAVRVADGPPLPPPGCEGLSPNSWQSLQNSGFVVKDQLREQCELNFPDPEASDGSAAKIATDSDEWIVYQQLWRIPLVLKAHTDGRKVRCYLSVKCEVTGSEGLAFQAEVEQRGDGPQLVVNAADVKGDGYQTYDLGVYDSLRGWIHLRVAAADNPDNVGAVYVDRAWMVAEETPE